MGSPLYKPVAPASRLVMRSSERLFPCVCEFVPPSIAAQKRHRKKCAAWRDRADPRGLMIARRKQTMDQPRAVLHCSVCERPVDHHLSSCPYSFSETARREAVERAGIGPDEFYVFLVALGKRYPKGWTGE